MNKRDVSAAGCCSGVIAAGMCVLAFGALAASEADQQKLAAADAGFAFKLCLIADERAEAARILGAANRVRPEIVAALKAALPDADSGVRSAATTALVWLRRKSRETGSAAVIIIPGEPSYWGKSLREWLQTRDGVDLSVEARVALRQMDTNAIPTLLWMLTYRDPEFGVWDDDLCSQAVLGFSLLGKAGTPALPKLKELIAGRDAQLSIYAFQAAANMGTNYNILDRLRIQSERDQTAASGF